MKGGFYDSDEEEEKVESQTNEQVNSDNKES